MKLFGKNIPAMFSLLIWFAIWELIGRSELITILPSFSGVLQAAGSVLSTDKFQHAALITLEGFLLGIGLAILVGIPLGILMGRVKSIEAIFGVWVNIFMSAPLTAVVPVLMVLFGFGQVTVILTVFLFAVWVIVLDTQTGIKQINPSLLNMADAFGASRQQLYIKILVLAALPEILAGVRLGVIRGCKGVIVGQLLIAVIGMGELFELYSRNFLMEEFWVLIIVVFAFAFLISEFVAYFERRIEYYASSR